MPQKSTDGVNMMNKCWWCVETFKDDDRVICEGSKLYHQRCLDERDSKNELKPYEEKYPYLSQHHIEAIMNEDKQYFDVIDNNNWIVILEGSTSTEVDLHGFKTKEELKNYIKEFYSENEGGWSIEAIYNCGLRYFHRIEVNVSLEASKLG